MTYAVFYYGTPEGYFLQSGYRLPLEGPAATWAEQCRDFLDEAGTLDAYRIYDEGKPLGKMVFRANTQAF